MKNITVIIALLFLTFQVISRVSIIYAIDISDFVSGAAPGINCGVAGAGDEREKCCYNPPLSMPRFFELVKDAPLVGEKITSMIQPISDKLDEFEEMGKGETDVCIEGGKPSADVTDKNCKCVAIVSSDEIQSIHELCTNYIKDDIELTSCHECVKTGGMYTGLGCVPLNVRDFISNFLLSWGIGIAGGISLLCIIYSALRMQMSMGNPEAIKKAQENLTACITGLILIIFSVFILKLIGVDILKIPFLQ